MHAHDHRGQRSRRALKWVLGLTASFALVEALGGWWTGSLALLADAGHMLSDVLSLWLALLAIWMAQKPATPERTYGYKRLEILVALANGVTLVLIGLWILWEAWRRWRQPVPILGQGMLVVALLGLTVNLVGLLALWPGKGESLNLAAAWRHVLADLLGSLGVLLAAAVILLTGWEKADPLISTVIALLVLGSSWVVLRDSVNILLESAPAGLDVRQLAEQIRAQPGVLRVEDLHIWLITSGFPALSAHLVVAAGTDPHRIRRQVERLLIDQFQIEHTTLQVEEA